MPTAINIGLHKAQEITRLDESEVLISIGNHVGTEHVTIPGQDDKILKVVFDDVTADIIYKGEQFFAITNPTALEIIQFINKNKDKNFIVHCHAGISRSSAVCLFINLVYGHKLKEDFYQTSHPNCFVLGKLLLFHLWAINYQD